MAEKSCSYHRIISTIRLSLRILVAIPVVSTTTQASANQNSEYLPDFTKMQCMIGKGYSRLMLVSPVIDRATSRNTGLDFSANLKRLVSERPEIRDKLREAIAEGEGEIHGSCDVRPATGETTWKPGMEYEIRGYTVQGRQRTESIEDYIPNWRALLQPNADVSMALTPLKPSKPGVLIVTGGTGKPVAKRTAPATTRPASEVVSEPETKLPPVTYGRGSKQGKKAKQE